MVGLIVAIYEVGCFFGSILTAFVGEQLGRRKSIGGGVIIMIIGALLQATSYSRAQMIVARIVAGIGMGAINSTIPVLQAEFSPKATRGICKSPHLKLLFTVELINISRLRSAEYPQLWNLFRLLDRLRLLLPHQ
jgi:MFS family permease